jgi:hypothetical protein
MMDYTAFVGCVFTHSIAKQNQQIAPARLSMYSAELHEASDQLISNISPRGDYFETGVKVLVREL